MASLNLVLHDLLDVLLLEQHHSVASGGHGLGLRHLVVLLGRLDILLSKHVCEGITLIIRWCCGGTILDVLAYLAHQR